MTDNLPRKIGQLGGGVPPAPQLLPLFLQVCLNLFRLIYNLKGGWGAEFEK